jgi:hypothetical protein
MSASNDSIRAELDAYRAETQAFRAESQAYRAEVLAEIRAGRVEVEAWRAEVAAGRAEDRAIFERLDMRMDAQDRDIRTLIEQVMAINDRLDRLENGGGQR